MQFFPPSGENRTTAAWFGEKYKKGPAKGNRRKSNLNVSAFEHI